jgi:hypothetical protein
MKKISTMWMVMVIFIVTAVTAYASDVNISQDSSDNAAATQKAGNDTIGCDVNPYSIPPGTWMSDAAHNCGEWGLRGNGTKTENWPLNYLIIQD